MKFTFIEKSQTTIYQILADTFANPWWMLGYILAMGIVALHISHGFWSLFQTFGLNHPVVMPVVMKIGILMTFAFGVGFSTLPVYLFVIS